MDSTRKQELQFGPHTETRVTIWTAHGKKSYNLDSTRKQELQFGPQTETRVKSWPTILPAVAQNFMLF